ncbi:hypothetical protein [Paracoccus mutanolyticus]|uniref:hypothetical protein n=1 Tax=Paracoccus mutanolyticus TaxID=1499308 RepID=UPI0011AE29F1|nr:hypothetical protein [Paracoccus mutanolyticus]
MSLLITIAETEDRPRSNQLAQDLPFVDAGRVNGLLCTGGSGTGACQMRSIHRPQKCCGDRSVGHGQVHEGKDSPHRKVWRDLRNRAFEPILKVLNKMRNHRR